VSPNERAASRQRRDPRFLENRDQRFEENTATPRLPQAAHPLADIFPLMEGAEFDALVADIRAKGLISPIIVLEDMVLDGRNRLAACAAAGVRPRFAAYAGGDPAGFVVSQNVARRHLDESQRSLIAAKLANMAQGARTDLQPSANSHEVSLEKAADMLNVSRRSVANAVAVIDKADPAVFKAVEQGRLAVSRAVEIIELPVEDQQSLAALPREDIVSSHERIKRAWARDETLRRIQAQAASSPAWPTARFPIIYADPAWKDDFGPNSRETERHFPTMETDDICALPVRKIVTDDGVLFLWALPHMLHKALRVMEAWGFEFRTFIVWEKDRAGLGQWARHQCEVLLIGRRGSFPPPPESLRPPQVIKAPRGKHSEKPAIFAELIQRWYPGIAKIELFCRGPAWPGWASWGNEAVAAETISDSESEAAP
jgi:N6-adenosine-specific RNA methylase IME4